MANILKGMGSYTYIVAPYGFYETIQSAIDAAVTDADTPATIFITPGTYTEDLTLYDNVHLKGSDEGDVVITGLHTPPVTGTILFTNIIFYSTTDIIQDLVNPGDTQLTFQNCGFALDNGYIFNLTNWTGSLAIDSCVNDVSTINGIVSNSGGSALTVIDSNVGQGTTTASISGVTIIKNNIINCPLTFTDTAAVRIEDTTCNGPLTAEDDVQLTIAHSRLLSDSAATVLTTTSTQIIYLENIIVDTGVAGSAIDGTGEIEVSEATFIDTDQIAGTLTVDYVSNLKASNITTHGVVDLPDTIDTGLAGVVRFDTDNFIHKMGTRNTFVGRECGYIGLTVVDATDNSGFGNEVLHDLTSGENNTGVGSYGLTHITTGSYNSTLGASALPVQTGSYNIAIGYQAGSSCTTTESSNILIGNTGTALESNCIRIGVDGAGDGQQSDNYQAGIYQTTVGAVAPNREVVWVDNNHKLFSTNWGFTVWVVATASLTMAVNTGYIVKNTVPAALLVLTLPATSVVGDILEITGYTVGMFQIAQNAGQQIFFGNQSTTAGGSITATHQYNSIKLVCCTDNTEWKLLSSVGVFNVV